MELEKRRRVAGEEATDGKTDKAGEEDSAKIAMPGDEEVEEFFSMLKRMQVALKYFQKRNVGPESTAKPWRPTFEPEDFDGVEKTTPDRNQNGGLDLNLDPASDVSGSVN